MGRNLARHGYAVAIPNRTPARTKTLVDEFGHEGTFIARIPRRRWSPRCGGPGA